MLDFRRDLLQRNHTISYHKNRIFDVNNANVIIIIIISDDDDGDDCTDFTSRKAVQLPVIFLFSL